MYSTGVEEARIRLGMLLTPDRAAMERLKSVGSCDLAQPDGSADRKHISLVSPEAPKSSGLVILLAQEDVLRRTFEAAVDACRTVPVPVSWGSIWNHQLPILHI